MGIEGFMSRQHRSEVPTAILGGLPISCIGMQDAARALIETSLNARGRHQRPFYSTSANGQVIALAHDDASFRQSLLKADQIHADGMPMVLLSRFVSKHPVPERVATTDLVHAVAEMAERTNVSFYFLGGTPDVNRRAVANMQRLYPRLRFAGSRHGYFSRGEEADIVKEISELKPDILWIGLGVPYEQKFVERNIEKLRGIGVIKTSGGLFDFLSGKNSRAPKWMQNAGLEWLYRTKLESKRLFGRYMKTNPVALWRLLFFSQ
ncbi:Glycosyltransferase [Hyphomicrobiales bacterium]|nr:Glycosyltransferase [Hyphomicrobiales bacterium]CAH1699200.1 Glycosyltransferase [Hyphomicrobiales bacterium]CAI0342986.1 N-acetylglucosaminyldiphosphoundecaprenol N-acetyl-beta-D-mannosaminyltransferase [Hyphomicrobiales bacterium]